MLVNKIRRKRERITKKKKIEERKRKEEFFFCVGYNLLIIMILFSRMRLAIVQETSQSVGFLFELCELDFELQVLAFEKSRTQRDVVLFGASRVAASFRRFVVLAATLAVRVLGRHGRVRARIT